MAVSNRERVGKGLDLLASGLRPFVERELKSHLGDNWQSALPDTPGRGPRAKPQPANLDDPQILLGLLWDQWNAVFKNTLGPCRAEPRQRVAGRSQPLGAQRAIQQQRRHPGARFDGAAAQRRLGRRSRRRKSARCAWT